MTEPAAYVYDLDGTLVRLAVDWDAATADVRGLYREAGLEADGSSLWELLECASEHGLEGDVEASIAAHEREGASRAVRLPAADELATRSVPVGVCSLNCEAACRIALETTGLLDDVEVIVGRDTVSNHKPDPEPLLTAIRALSVAPAETMFFGDSERDALTAERAGIRFSYIDGDSSGH